MNHLSLGKLNLLMVPVHLWITHPKPPSQKASHSRSSKRSFFSTEEYIAPRAANIHLTAQPLYPSTSDNPYYWQNSKNECLPSIYPFRNINSIQYSPFMFPTATTQAEWGLHATFSYAF